MSGAESWQAAALLRLRDQRLTGASIALEAARARTMAARTAAATAEARRAAADAANVAAHRALAADPSTAHFRLALLDRARFDQAVSRAAHEAAVEAQDRSEQEVAERRGAVLRARVRLDALGTHVAAMTAAAARRCEEAAAREAEDDGRKG